MADERKHTPKMPLAGRRSGDGVETILPFLSASAPTSKDHVADSPEVRAILDFTEQVSANARLVAACREAVQRAYAAAAANRQAIQAAVERTAALASSRPEDA